MVSEPMTHARTRDSHGRCPTIEASWFQFLLTVPPDLGAGVVAAFRGPDKYREEIRFAIMFS
jgi:hypothetical protein